MHDIREVDNRIEILVEWEGMPEHEEWSWEPLDHLAEDVPELTKSFLSTARKRTLKLKARSTQNL